jgi:hypothetical protein
MKKNFTGETKSVFIESNCSVAFIDPNLADKDDPIFAENIRALSTGESSLVTKRYTTIGVDNSGLIIRLGIFS